MIHILFHFAVPLLGARLLYQEITLKAWLIMISTMLIDLDHLLADPIYDPARCSIGFHPLHQLPVFASYLILLITPVFINYRKSFPEWSSASQYSHLIGMGLTIHILLDALDCVL